MGKLDEDINSPRKFSRKRAFVSEVFHDYCSSTSLHGIGYLGADDKSTPEKIWWIIVFILSLISCSYLIFQTWTKWKNDPVILSFQKEQIPIWDIPFPAITVCPVNKINQKKYNYTEMFRNRDNLTDEEYKVFWDLSLLCNLEQYEIEFDCTVNVTNEEAIEKMLEYVPKAQPETRWQSKYTINTFERQITEEGICFTFNSLGQEDMFTSEVNSTNPLIMHEKKISGWSIEGYTGTVKKTDYPLRTAKDGISSGLSFTLHAWIESIDFVCGTPITGYKVILHNPAEVPAAAQQYFLVPSNRKANIVIEPQLTKTSKALLTLPPTTRKCFFEEEKSLKYFKVYTQTNCRMECDANITLKYCDCVPFYLPRNSETPICGYGNLECVKEVESTILELEMHVKETNMSEYDQERIEFTREIFDKCNCLPSCNSLQYSGEISQTEYVYINSLLASGIFEQRIPEKVLEQLKNGYLQLTQIDIFFKESEFYALQRSEIYGRVDFLANVGGLLGLFMGFSLLSLLEIIYFLTIRVWFKCTNKEINTE